MEVTFELPLMVEKTSQGNGELMLELKVHPVATCIDELSAGDAPEVARVTARRTNGSCGILRNMATCSNSIITSHRATLSNSRRMESRA